MSAISRGTTIVVDASVAVAAIFPFQTDFDALGHFSRWLEGRVSVVAPDCFYIECSSAIRKLVHARAIGPDRGEAALESLFALGVAPTPITQPLCRSALHWAERLGQSRACDGVYLAVAESLRTELWTADRRLVNSARQAGASWVREVS
jgi:predicted nucleic acid-binding protein